MSAGVSYAVWAVLASLVLLAWARSHAPHSRIARPSDVLARLSTRPVVRIVVVVAWMWAGWHLFAR